MSSHLSSASIPPTAPGRAHPRPPTAARPGRARALGLVAGLAVALSGWTGVTAWATPSGQTAGAAPPGQPVTLTTAAPPGDPVTVANSDVLARAAASSDPLVPAPHVLDVVMLSASGQERYASDIQLLDVTSSASAFWSRESRGVVTRLILGTVGTASYDPATQPNPCSAEAFDPMMQAAVAALGVPTSQYWGGFGAVPTRRHLVVLTTQEFIAQWPDACAAAGRGTLGSDLASGGEIWATFSTTAPAVVHELGHNVGLQHAAATPSSCADSAWDGPFDIRQPPVDAAACPMADRAYEDGHNIMGSGANAVLKTPHSSPEDSIISGLAKAKLGLITPGAGLVAVNPTTADQILTIDRTETQDRAAPQSILLTETVPGCGTQVHTIDYDPAVGGVRVFRVADARDCQTHSLLTWADTIVLTSDSASDRQYLPVDQPRRTQSGETEITVVSADGPQATIRLHTVWAPPPATLTVSPTELRLPASGGKQTATIATDQSGLSIRPDHAEFDYTTKANAQGASITVSAGANKTGVERSATFTITAGPATTTLRVVQPATGAATTTLTLSRTTWNPGKSARWVRFTVTSGQAWQVAEIPPWASLKTTGTTRKGAQKVRLSVQRNTGPARTGVVRFETMIGGQVVTAEFVITQKGARGA